MIIFRRVGAVVLAAVCALLLISSGIVHALGSVGGSSGQVASTVVAIASSPGVEKAISVAAINDISQRSSPNVQAVIAKERPALQADIVRTLNTASTQALLRSDVQQGYDAFTSSSGGSVNLRPLILLFTTSLHKTTPAIPLIPVDLSNTVVHIKAHKSFGSVSHSLNVMAWIELVLGLIGAVLVARFLVRRHRNQLTLLGVTIGAPAVVLLVVATVTNHLTRRIHPGNQSGRVILSNLVYRFDSSLRVDALVLLIIDVVAVGGWYLLHRLQHQRTTGRGGSEIDLASPPAHPSPLDPDAEPTG